MARGSVICQHWSTEWLCRAEIAVTLKEVIGDGELLFRLACRPCRKDIERSIANKDAVVGPRYKRVENPKDDICKRIASLHVSWSEQFVAFC